MKDRLEKAGIDIKTDRWAEGVPHHPMSESIVRDLVEIDLQLFNDHFCWKVGGDGDNGESLMYELDYLFELYDAEKSRTLCQQCGEAINIVSNNICPHCKIKL